MFKIKNGWKSQTPGYGQWALYFNEVISILKD